MRRQRLDRRRLQEVRHVALARGLRLLDRLNLLEDLEVAFEIIVKRQYARVITWTAKAWAACHGATQ